MRASSFRIFSNALLRSRQCRFGRSSNTAKPLRKRCKLICVSLLLLSVCMSSLSCCAVERPSSNARSLPQQSQSLASGSPLNTSSFADDKSIRTVDFRNFTYDWYPAWADVPNADRKIILKNGSMELGVHYGKEPREFFLTDRGENSGVKYGDLSGDGKEEAVVVLGVITSGSARPNIVFVFGMSGDTPKIWWVRETGDRADHGYHNASIRNGQLLLETYKPRAEKFQTSNSDTYIRDYYKWTGVEFKKIQTQEIPVDPQDDNPWVIHLPNR